MTDFVWGVKLAPRVDEEAKVRLGDTETLDAASPKTRRLGFLSFMSLRPIWGYIFNATRGVGVPSG